MEMSPRVLASRVAMLDELLAAYTRENPRATPLTTTVLDMMSWLNSKQVQKDLREPLFKTMFDGTNPLERLLIPKKVVAKADLEQLHAQPITTTPEPIRTDPIVTDVHVDDRTAFVENYPLPTPKGGP